jgi:DNA-binding NtrC family response regulator
MEVYAAFGEYCDYEIGRSFGRPPAGLTHDAKDALLNARWPGNIRELRNALERAVVFSRAEILEPKDFPENIRQAVPSLVGATANLRSLEEIEKEAIAATLEATHYKIGRASEILGISRKTLLEKRKKYELK